MCLRERKDGDIIEKEKEEEKYFIYYQRLKSKSRDKKKGRV